MLANLLAYQINATRAAAVNAGFTVLRTIHEPTAAAMAYGLHTNSQVHTVMVYDIGGGTLDVSLLNLNNGIFEVMAASGDNRLGGQVATGPCMQASMPSNARAARHGMRGHVCVAAWGWR